MNYPIELNTPHCTCSVCGRQPRVATMNQYLESSGIDPSEWDYETHTTHWIQADKWYDKLVGAEDHRERKFFDWGRSNGLNEHTLYVLVSNDINRIATLMSMSLTQLNNIAVSKGQRIVLRSLMKSFNRGEDSKCMFCGTFHASSRDTCHVLCKYPYTPHSSDCTALKRSYTDIDYNRDNEKAVKSHTIRQRCFSSMDENDKSENGNNDDPITITVRRGRRNTTGQNFDYLNCHPKYWADMLPVPTKLIKML